MTDSILYLINALDAESNCVGFFLWFFLCSRLFENILVSPQKGKPGLLVLPTLVFKSSICPFKEHELLFFV